MSGGIEKKTVIDHVAGFDIRPGLYLMNGAFTVSGVIPDREYILHDRLRN